MGEVELPEAWSSEWVRKRPVRIRFRRGDSFSVRPEYEPSDGRIVHVRYPRVMEEGEHSLYAGSVCWDVDYADGAADVPVYLCEGDFEWLPEPPAKP